MDFTSHYIQYTDRNTQLGIWDCAALTPAKDAILEDSKVRVQYSYVEDAVLPHLETLRRLLHEPASANSALVLANATLEKMDRPLTDMLIFGPTVIH